MFLKELHPFLNTADRKIKLIPSNFSKGELIIGVKDIQPLQTLSLLFQFEEGTENPAANTFEAEDNIQWSVLCANEWKALSSRYLLKDTTNKFLLEN